MSKNLKIPPPPSKFRRDSYLYFNKKMLKKSNFSKVFVATQLFNKKSKEVILKYIPLKGKNKQIDVEVDIQNSIENKYVMPLIDNFVLDNNFRVLVMEKGLGTLISGFDTADNFFKSLQHVYKMMYQIAKGIRHLHENKILHGDIKPSNILVMDDNEHMPLIQIIDFGFSVQMLSSEKPFCECKNFSPEFCAPELLRCLPHSFSADIWSLGATFYFMITQELVCQFDQPTFELNALKLDDLNLTYTNRFGPSFPQSGKKLISDMLNKSPELRPSIDEVLESDFFKEVLDQQWIEEENIFYNMPVQNLVIEQSLDTSDD